MRSTAPLSTGMQIAIPLSGASAADTGRLALPESPCCRGRHDFPDEPLSPLAESCRSALRIRTAEADIHWDSADRLNLALSGPSECIWHPPSVSVRGGIGS